MAQIVLVGISVVLFGGGVLLLGHGVLQWVHDKRDQEKPKPKGSPSHAA